MAKLNYVEGDYKEALNIYARVGLDDLPLTAVPPYRLRVLAEAYATKGEAGAVCPWEGVPQGGAVWSQQSLPGACGLTPGPLAGDGRPGGRWAGPTAGTGQCAAQPHAVSSGPRSSVITEAEREQHVSQVF